MALLVLLVLPVLLDPQALLVLLDLLDHLDPLV